MITYTQEGTNGVVRVVETNIIRQTALAKGDKLYMTKNPEKYWLENMSGGNPHSRVRHLAVKFVGDEPVVVQVYMNQFSRVDRKTKKLVFPEDSVNRVLNDAGTKGFNKKFAGHFLEVEEVNEECLDYKYTATGARETDAEGNDLYTATRAFKFKVAAAKDVNDADMQKLIEQWMNDNLKEVEAENNEE